MTPTAQPGSDEYIVFVDESGDHGLSTVDPDYPLFVLALCVFRKQDYIESICPSIQRFKFRYWGHDSVVLHEHDLRKPSGAFGFLFDRERRQAFMSDLNALMESARFTLIASVVHKNNLKQTDALPRNPYHICLEFGLEQLYKFLESRRQIESTTHVVVECRGRREDADLELEFRRICSGANSINKQLPFNIVMSPKQSNAPGMQLADLVARPIGIKVLRPAQANRAYEILAAKFDRGPQGEVEGWGMKCFP